MRASLSALVAGGMTAFILGAVAYEDPAWALKLAVIVTMGASAYLSTERRPMDEPVSREG